MPFWTMPDVLPLPLRDGFSLVFLAFVVSRCKLGTHDLRQRYSPIRRGNGRNWIRYGGRFCPQNLSEVFSVFWGGLSLGWEGPSIQLGAMTGKGLPRTLKRGKTQRKISADLGSQRRAGCCFRCASGGSFIFVRRNS